MNYIKTFIFIKILGCLWFLLPVLLPIIIISSSSIVNRVWMMVLTICLVMVFFSVNQTRIRVSLQVVRRTFMFKDNIENKVNVLIFLNFEWIWYFNQGSVGCLTWDVRWHHTWTSCLGVTATHADPEWGSKFAVVELRDIWRKRPSLTLFLLFGCSLSAEKLNFNG